MARRNGNEVQDRLLVQMERISRNNPTDYQNKSLEEQLKEANLPPEEKQKRKTPRDWHRDLIDIVNMDRTIGTRLFQWSTVKYKADIEKFRTDGVPYKEVLAFIRSKATEFMNL
jgi:hypothetical protein